MNNIVAFWFLLVPILYAVAFIVWANARRVTISWGLMTIYFVVSVVAIFGTFALYSSYQTSATEILNGQVTGKQRIEGSYVQSYSCNCRTDKSGSQSCDTCYTDHYTVDWECNSNVGNIRIAYEDWLSSAVYGLPNPARWTGIRNGDAVSVSHRYTNYVQAVPQSLFQTHFSADASLKKMVPKYPSHVEDYYHVNRFLPVGVAVPDAYEWNTGIQEMLKTRGPTKQVNAIVVVVNTADEKYQYVLQNAWLDGSKNDVILVVGSTNYPKIDWVGVLSWTKNNLFKIQLHDAVQSLGTMDREKVLMTLENQIDQNFERRHMSDFAYLKSEISPPTWLLSILAAWLAGGMAIVAKLHFLSNQYRRFK